MKPVICVYHEGNDTKFGVFVKEKGQVRLLRAASVDIYASGPKSGGQESMLQMLDSDG
ncbi:MAG: hypothetical protein HYV28_15640, partial [Ignavibacteriales bacterium]|nr:hypothetical protein [Ignavibacteriales bacterium]